MSKLKWIIAVGWPITVAIVGAFVMIWAGVNDCSSCPLLQNLYGMEWWGWIGLAAVLFVILRFFYSLFVGLFGKDDPNLYGE